MEALGDPEAVRRFRHFAQDGIAPSAATSDKAGRLDPASVEALRSHGYFGCVTPRALGGLGMDQISYGLLTAEVGRACSATRTLMTVHHLTSAAVLRWATPETKATLVPRLARGEEIAAFALSEPGAGSDASALSTTIHREGDNLVISGKKCWVSFGQIASVLLVIGRSDEGMTAVLVPHNTPGLHKQPVNTMVSTRASMMAEITLDRCKVPATWIVGRAGFGLSHVVTTALDHGRYSVAWGSVGIAEAAVHASCEFTQSRSQFGSLLRDKPLMRARLTRIAVAARAARALCMEAGRLREAGAPSAIVETMVAKYAASKAAVYATNEAVQIHGARGLLEEQQIERLLRDAKVTEIIEGSSDILELLLGEQNLGDDL